MFATPTFPFLLHLFANLETLVTSVRTPEFKRKGRFVQYPGFQSWSESTILKALLEPASSPTLTVLKPFQSPEIQAGQ